MAKTRQKKVLVSDVTNEKMEAAMADFARADARIQKINATLDVEMTRLREKYQDEMARLNAEKEADRAPILDIVTALTAEVEQALASKTDKDKA